MRSNISKNFKNIVISEQNYQALKLMGNVGDSFNDVITNLIENKNGGDR
jgi:predicted CopG family antitoxin